jgi:hypothetical protein
MAKLPQTKQAKKTRQHRLEFQKEQFRKRIVSRVDEFLDRLGELEEEGPVPELPVKDIRKLDLAFALWLIEPSVRADLTLKPANTVPQSKPFPMLYFSRQKLMKALAAKAK